MRYHAIACDYDGTLAHNGLVDAATVKALEQLLASGRKLLLVTGRELPSLLATFCRIDLFEVVIAENGAVLYIPSKKEERTLASAPPSIFRETLLQRGVERLSFGKVIVAGWRPDEATILSTIQELGLDLQVIFNKEAVIVLPSGVNKATGLAEALKQLSLSRHNVIGIGDAENDHSFLRMCECAVAVNNALPMVKETADMVTSRDRGEGVQELIREVLADDLKKYGVNLKRHFLKLGKKLPADGAQEVLQRPYHTAALIAGASGSGKSTVATTFVEQLAERGYQFCIFDPEGDYDSLETVITVGGPAQAPNIDEVFRLLDDPEQNVVLNLLGIPLSERPPFATAFLMRLQEMRSSLGRPHWIVIDEAHHLFPTTWHPVQASLPQKLDRILMITVHPDQISGDLIEQVNVLLVVGDSPAPVIEQFLSTRKEPMPEVPSHQVEQNQVLYWDPRERTSFYFELAPSRTERRRHTRKYAEGTLPAERSFFFRGPDDKLNLRAQNLMVFVQLSEGVDDETWLFHLKRKDYSAWFRGKIKDEELAVQAEEISARPGLSAAESRALIRGAIEARYTAPSRPSYPMPGTDAEERTGDSAERERGQHEPATKGKAGTT